MIDSFLSIPDAESLPLYRMVLKLACVWHLREALTPVKIYNILARNLYLIPVATFLCWIPAATFSLLVFRSYILTLHWIPVATPQLCWIPAATFSLLDSSSYIYTLFWIPVATSPFATHMLLHIPFGAGVEHLICFVYALHILLFYAIKDRIMILLPLVGPLPSSLCHRREEVSQKNTRSVLI